LSVKTPNLLIPYLVKHLSLKCLALSLYLSKFPIIHLYQLSIVMVKPDGEYGLTTTLSPSSMVEV
jgi:hypothetical protein